MSAESVKIIRKSLKGTITIDSILVLIIYCYSIFAHKKVLISQIFFQSI